MYKLDSLGIPYSVFREPDLGNIITAIASEGNEHLYKKLPLLGSPKSRQMIEEAQMVEA